MGRRDGHKKPDARRHHTVPKRYLLGFARKEQIALHQRGRSGAVVTNVLNASVERDFYAFTRDGRRDAGVEAWLNVNVEKPTLGALEALRQGEPLTEEHRTHLSLAIAFFLTRTRAARALMRQLDDHLRPLVWSSVALSHVENVEHLSFGEKARLMAYFREHLPPALSRTDEDSHLRTMVREADRLAPLLLQRAWSVAESELRLIVSDNPVVQFFPAGQPEGFRGLAPAEAQLLFPIDASRLLIIEPVGIGAAPSPIALTDELALIANRAQAAAADRDVYRHPDMPWPSGVHLGGTAPVLPTPQVTFKPNDGTPPTFPATYPVPNRAEVRGILDHLGATPVVE